MNGEDAEFESGGIPDCEECDGPAELFSIRLGYICHECYREKNKKVNIKGKK